jgi:outer membrane protein TolC
MRWKVVLVGVALVIAGVFGCKQQCFLPECDYEHYRKIGLPATLETSAAAIVPTTPDLPSPATVLNPERPIRYLSLAEAIATALEQGTTGSGIIGGPNVDGTSSTTLGQFQGRTFATTADQSIRVLALEPAIAHTEIEASLSKFDVLWNTSLTWTKNDNAVPNLLANFQNGESAQFSSQLLKPLPTGGVAGITFSTNYNLLTAPPAGSTFVNPAWQPRVQLLFEQPLLQGFGVDINQLRSTHPNSRQSPFQSRPIGGAEGIVITRLRFDQQRADFERSVQIMLANVEVAYWNLYGAYWNLYTREQGLRQAYEAWRINKSKYDAGTLPIHELATTRGQYEQFRGERLTALGQVLEAERNLRGLMGLPVEDGVRLVPLDTPTLAPYQPDWATALNEALTLRPELVLARQEVKFRQLDLISAKNLMLPDLRFTSTYDVNGIGTHLDGDDPNNALKSLTGNNFNTYSFGLTMQVPLGFRDAHALVRRSRLNLARSYAVLRDQELRAQAFLAVQYRRVLQAHQQIQVQRSRREAATTQLAARFMIYLAGKETLQFLLQAQREWADALRDEYVAIVDYNNALVTFEFAKGTILQHDNVYIAEGPLPQCAQVRAVEHERERSKALLLRERAGPPTTPPCDYDQGKLGVPSLPADAAPSVPALFKDQPPVPELPPDPVPPKMSGPALGSIEWLEENRTTPPDMPSRMPPGAPAALPAELSGTDPEAPAKP